MTETEFFYFISFKRKMSYLARPLKNFPMAMKSSWSEQLNTTHWIAIAFAKSWKVKELFLYFKQL